MKSWKIFVVVNSCRKQLNVKTSSTPCVIWNPVVCLGRNVLEFALMARPQSSAQ
jgi:hypothetical protein